MRKHLYRAFVCLLACLISLPLLFACGDKEDENNKDGGNNNAPILLPEGEDPAKPDLDNWDSD